MRISMLLAAGLLLSAPLALAAESGTVTRASQLLAEPYTDAANRGTLRASQSVDVIERRGGWYHVQADDGQQGWLRLSSIRLGEPAAEESGGGFWASLFSFTGRSQARTASATTGIRGLSEEEITAATPNPQAVERLATFAPDDSEARAFASEIGLRPGKVDALPEDAPGRNRKQGGRK